MAIPIDMAINRAGVGPRQGDDSEDRGGKRRAASWAGLQIDGRETATPEVALWRAVVLRALADGLWPDAPEDVGDEPAQTRASREERRARKGRALKWLLKGGYDFRLVCSMANLDEGAIVWMTKRALKEGLPPESYIGRAFGLRG